MGFSTESPLGFIRNKGSVYRRFLAGAALVLAATWTTAAAPPKPGLPFAEQQKQAQQKKQPAKPDSTAAASMVGCIDQGADGGFLLIDPRNREKLADLAAEGFPMEGFAKYLGKKVTVHGTSSGSGTSTSFRVRKVEVASDVCEPEQ